MLWSNRSILSKISWMNVYLDNSDHKIVYIKATIEGVMEINDLNNPSNQFVRKFGIIFWINNKYLKKSLPNTSSKIDDTKNMTIK